MKIIYDPKRLMIGRIVIKRLDGTKVFEAMFQEGQREPWPFERIFGEHDIIVNYRYEWSDMHFSGVSSSTDYRVRDDEWMP